ncbi:MAG: XdhC family protein [Spirochaetes bacterium]|nr:XdhC family protein [Spirochaetota bacterium]
MTLDDIQELAAARQPCVLLTLLASSGSSPRHAGSVMLLHSDGRQSGTIGGGEGEAQALVLARQALQESRSFLAGTSMHGSSVLGGEQICGGENRLLVEYIDDTSVYAQAATWIQSGKSPLLVKTLSMLEADTSSPGTATEVHVQVQLDAANTNSRRQAWFDESKMQYCHPLRPLEQLLVLGAGHIGQAIARVAQALGFAISVADDRSDYLAGADLPTEATRLQGEFAAIIDNYAFTPATYIIVATRSHALDFDCTRRILKKPHCYAGLVGSAAKTRLVIEKLQQAGIPEDTVAGLFAPIGLDLGSETPQEIAVAIMAEIIACRHGRVLPVSLRQQNRQKAAGIRQAAD